MANRNDPLGLYWGEEFVNTAVEVATQGAADCLDVLDANCETIAEQHPEGSNQVADTAGGYLNAVTLGLGEKMFDDEVSWGSSHAQMGSLLGAVMLLPLAVGSPAGWDRCRQRCSKLHDRAREGSGCYWKLCISGSDVSAGILLPEFLKSPALVGSSGLGERDCRVPCLVRRLCRVR